DNVNVNLTNDVQRALPAAIVGFARQHRFPGTSVEMVEHDVWPHDTGYIPYLAVSALALDAMVIAGILGAMATAREWERATVKLLPLARLPGNRARRKALRRRDGGGGGAGPRPARHRGRLRRGADRPVGLRVRAPRLRRGATR